MDNFDIDDDLSLENLNQLVEERDEGEVYRLQSLVKNEITEVIGEKLDKEDRNRLWRLIHGLRNLAITRCNIEDEKRNEVAEEIIEEIEERLNQND